MFYSRFPCLPLPPARPAPAEVAATNGAAELEPDLAAKRAKAAAAARARRARRRTAREAARLPRRNGQAEPALELDPAAIVEPQAEPAPVRICERCGASFRPASPNTRYCSRECRRRAGRAKTAARAARGPDERQAWPPAVAALDDKLRDLESQTEVERDPERLPALRTEIRSLAGKIEAAKAAALAAGGLAG